MITRLTVVKYPKWMGWAGILSMAFFRIPLVLSKKISFWKLMGSGKNGTFDLMPDWRQWAILCVYSTDEDNYPIPTFILSWWKLFKVQKWDLLLEPIEGHGTWDKIQCFGSLANRVEYEGRIAVLTRATIRVSKLTNFWSNVNSVAAKMATADGFVQSIGIGEVPWIKQATFSIWESKAQMKVFAYQLTEHAEVIRKTKKENWYSEELFVRFRILSSTDEIHKD